MADTATQVHPALACFDEETRKAAYTLMATLPRWGDMPDKDPYLVDEEGERHTICPMGACLFALGGNINDLFPMSYSQILTALAKMGRADLMSQISAKAFRNLIFLAPVTNESLAATFGVPE